MEATLENNSQSQFTYNEFLTALHDLSQPVMAINNYITGSLIRLKRNTLNINMLADVLTKVGKNAELIDNGINALREIFSECSLDILNKTINLPQIITEIISKLSKSNNFQANISFVFDANKTELIADRINVTYVLTSVFNFIFSNIRTKKINLNIKIKKAKCSTSVLVEYPNNNDLIQKNHFSLEACHSFLQNDLSIKKNKKGITFNMIFMDERSQ